MALNVMLTNEYKIASQYLEQCLFILKILKRDGFRICNISKLFGLLAICYYRMGKIYSSKMNLQSSMQYLDHLYTTDVNAKGADRYLWGDDLFLCHYNNALLLMEDEKYEEALNEFENAQEYIVASPGFQFFSVTQYCIDKATLYRRMGREADAEQLLLKGIQFCEKQGYGFKAEMISRYCNKMEAKPAKWNFLLDGITLKQIENNVESLAVRYSNKRQEHNMEFLSVWQKMVEGYADTTENLVVTSIKTFKKYSPIYKNEKMDSIFVSYSFLRES